MRSSLPPPLWVGFAVMAVVAGAQIPEGLLMEETIVAPPQQAARQHQTSSANRHEGHSGNAVELDEDVQIVSEEEGATCYMEIQETRRIPGRCVSLGRSRGCVAGIYLHPFHHECQ